LIILSMEGGVMSALVVLIAASALAGVALGLMRLHWIALALAGLVIALGAAALLRAGGFDILPGVAVIFACLAANQIAYLAGAALSLFVFKDAEPTALATDQPETLPRKPFSEPRRKQIARQH
jgi:hypothetical protein